MSFISFDNIIKILTKYWDKFLIDGVYLLNADRII